ncbi:hypothetical protein CN97_00710 [Haematobacter massiliensis]|uniref:Uncharacterized protein n=2 Tax=Haematobacter massiliensis TaxID=195105 RepID=A0A086Y0I3_9RHOB|nr:hypothetical protein CN97_00710 [Haematobacter massiliensis]
MELSRQVDEALMSAIEGETFHPVMLLWLDWPSGEVRMHSGKGTIVWHGEEWLGVGDASSVVSGEEGLGMAASTATLRLASSSDEIMARISDPIRNREGKLYWGAVTQPQGNVLVGEPINFHEGYMDSSAVPIEADDTGITHYIEITLASGPGARSVSSIYHTAEDQSRKYPGDTAGRHVINALARTETQRWPEN